MLNMKKILIAGTVMTALCATAFAATNDQADKPTMKERVNRILCENRGDCQPQKMTRQERHDKRAKEAMAKLTPEQRAEVEAFIKDDMAQRQARREKLQNMTPEQRHAIKANRPLKMKDGKHFKGKHFRGHGPAGPRPDCPVPPCPVAPAK